MCNTAKAAACSKRACIPKMPPIMVRLLFVPIDKSLLRSACGIHQAPCSRRVELNLGNVVTVQTKSNDVIIGKMAPTGAKANAHIHVGSSLSVSNIESNGVPPALKKDFLDALQACHTSDANKHRTNAFTASVEPVELCDLPGNVDESRGAPERCSLREKSEHYPKPASGRDVHAINTHVVVRQIIFVQFEDGKRVRARCVDTLVVGIKQQVSNHALYNVAVEHESQGYVAVKVCQQYAGVVERRTE